VRMIVSIVVTLLMLVHYGQGLYGYIIGLVSGELIVLIILSPVLSKLFREGFNSKRYFELIKYSISFVPHRLMGILMIYVGIYFINIYIGKQELGLYSIAEKITLPLIMVIGSVQQAWVPIKFEIIAAEKNPFDVISKILSSYILILMFLYILVAMWGEFLLPILVSNVFSEAFYYIPFLALIHVSNALYFIYSSAIEAGKTTYLLPLSSFSGLLITTFLSYKFIPLYGSAAAALSLSFGWITMALVVNLISKRQIKIKTSYLVVFFSTIVLTLIFKHLFPHDVYFSIIGMLIFLLLFIVFF
jgi:O-antigen/teichoic acid export membrane protein